jgi:hypothetical protein
LRQNSPALVKAVRGFLQFWICWLLAAGVATAGGSAAGYAKKVSNLIAPAKLATLGERGANPRVQKYVALLAEAKAAGVRPSAVAGRAVAVAGMKGDAAKLTAKQMVRNLEIAERLGCVDTKGLAEMRRGRAPRVRRGPYEGDELSVDHIIPRVVVPELDKAIANLELMPLRVNERKNAQIGERQIDLARKLYRAGLLSADGLRKVEGVGLGEVKRAE